MGVATADRKKAKVQLTERERDILKGVLAEKTYSEIGTHLGLGFETIKTYLTRIRTKLGIRTKAGLAVWAATNLK